MSILTKSNRYISNSYLDGHTLTGIDPDNADYFISTVKECQSEYAINFTHEKGHYRYRYKCQVPIGKKLGVLNFSCKDDGGWKATWNSSLFCMQDEIKLREHLQGLLGTTFDTLWKIGCITALDYAYDRAFTDPDDYFFTQLYTKKIGVLNEQKVQVNSLNTGKTQTIYLGGEKPPIVIYNKSLQLTNNKKKNDYKKYRNNDLILEQPRHSLCRIERRYSKQHFFPSKLVCNPPKVLKGFKVYGFSKLIEQNIISEHFVDSIHRRGLKPALARLMDGQRQEVEQAIYRSEVTEEFLKSHLEQRTKAFSSLMVLAPERQWNAYIKGHPRALMRYYHTGVITSHFRQQVGKLKPKPANYYGAQKILDEHLGMPITRVDAEKLIRINHE